MNKYQERLLNEWRTHSKIIVATDFDSTISYWKTIENQEDIQYAVKVLKLCKEIGAYLTIFTACKEDRFQEIREYCISIGLNIDSINKNPVELPYGNTSKIYANVFIDDRTLSLRESLEMLEEVAYRMRAEQHSPTDQTVEF